MGKLTAHGYRNYKSEIRVQLFLGDPDRQGYKELANMTERECLELIEALTLALGSAQAE
jgi:hypothetical protein